MNRAKLGSLLATSSALLMSCLAAASAPPVHPAPLPRVAACSPLSPSSSALTQKAPPAPFWECSDFRKTLIPSPKDERWPPHEHISQPQGFCSSKPLTCLRRKSERTAQSVKNPATTIMMMATAMFPRSSDSAAIQPLEERVGSGRCVTALSPAHPAFRQQAGAVRNHDSPNTSKRS